MKRTITFGLVATLAAGLGIAAFAGSDHEGRGPTPEQRKEFLEKHLANLPAPEQSLARTLEPLRDSLRHAIGDYHHKVKDGATARSLKAERAIIVSLQAQIQKLQADNQEVWLDLLADLPGPVMKGGREGKGPPWMDGKGGPDCPRHGDMKDCPRHRDGENPPPPPPID